MNKCHNTKSGFTLVEVLVSIGILLVFLPFAASIAIRRRGHDKEALAGIQKYHQDILNAIVKQDKEGAMRELAEHIQASQRERVNEYDQWRREVSMRQSMPAFLNHPMITSHR